MANIKDRPPIFEAEALHEVLEDMAWTAATNWVDTQVHIHLHRISFGLHVRGCSMVLPGPPQLGYLARYSALHIPAPSSGLQELRRLSPVNLFDFTARTVCKIVKSQCIRMLQVITLSYTSGDNVPDIHDDMARELAFYTAAKSAADDAIARFDGASIPWQRPPDYYAESVKSDGHMAKVKQQLMYEEQAIEQAEQRYAAATSCSTPLQRITCC